MSLFFLSGFKWIYIIIDSAIFPILSFSIIKLFNLDKNNFTQILIIFLLFSIPPSFYGNAGWIVTALNYTWPITLGIICFFPIKHALNNRKTKPYEYFLYPLLALFANNQEQFAVVFLGAYLILGIYLIKKKKFTSIIFIMLVISILSIIFELLCPGNKIRFEESKNEILGFENYSIIDKIWLGISDTFNIFKTELVLPFYFCILIIITNIISKTTLKLNASFENKQLYNSSPKEITFLEIIIFVLTLGSRILMGFSPTIYASTTRTFLILIIGSIIISGLEFQKFDIKTKKYSIYPILFFTILQSITLIKYSIIF